MRPRFGRFALALVPVALPIAAAAQSTSTFACHPPANSNEAKLLAFFAAPLTFSPQGRPAHLARGAVVLAGDLTWVPKPPASISRSTGVCGFQKSENAGLAAVFPRPRLIVGLGGGFSAEATYLPPITVQDATPNFGSVAVAWSPEGAILGDFDLAVRAHATFGHVRGPITCPRSELQTTNANGVCHGNTPSNDTYEPNVKGVEASIGRGSGRGGWYVGAGYASLAPHFLVGFTSLNGNVDHNTIDVTLSRVSLFGGGTWAWTPTVTLSAQLYSIPQDATTGRLGLAWRLR